MSIGGLIGGAVAVGVTAKILVREKKDYKKRKKPQVIRVRKIKIKRVKI